MKENLILDKSFAFSVRAVQICRQMQEQKQEFTLSKQLLRSATSIGANVHEASNAHGKKDFIAKMYIAYKEATETEYWIKLLTATEYITGEEGTALLTDCVELKKILTAILQTAKGSL